MRGRCAGRVKPKTETEEELVADTSLDVGMSCSVVAFSLSRREGGETGAACTATQMATNTRASGSMAFIMVMGTWYQFFLVAQLVGRIKFKVIPLQDT